MSASVLSRMCLVTAVLVTVSRGVIHASEPEVIGATVIISVQGHPFPARVDTGATTSSIHAVIAKVAGRTDDLTIRESDKGELIEFTILNMTDDEKCPTPRDHHAEDSMTRVIADTVLINKEDRRAKVILDLDLAGFEPRGAASFVTLNDRNARVYPFLIGRNLLENNFIVDVSVDQSVTADDFEKLAVQP